MKESRTRKLKNTYLSLQKELSNIEAQKIRILLRKAATKIDRHSRKGNGRLPGQFEVREKEEEEKEEDEKPGEAKSRGKIPLEESVRPGG